jgi:hypothetical protein
VVIISNLDQSGQTKNLGCEKMKIKCFRFECEVCKEVSSIQVFSRKDETVGYARARHKNSQGFFYHPIPKEYVIEKLSTLCKLDQGQLPIKSIDPNNPDLSPELYMARDVGLEPTRPFDHRLSRPAPYQAWGIPHAHVSHIKLSSVLFRCSMLLEHHLKLSFRHSILL